MKVSFTVFGKPIPQGSMRAFTPKGWKRPILTSANPALKSWRQELVTAAREAVFQSTEVGFPIKAGIPVRATLRFFFAAPKREKGGIKATRPDADKLLRSCLDGMSGVVYCDDAQVAHAEIFKLFGIPERVEIEVSECETNGKLF